MVIWLVIAVLVGAACGAIQVQTVRKIDPANQSRFSQHFTAALVLRFLIIGVFLWRLVFQELTIILISFFVFLSVYLGGVILVALKRPQWFEK
ncbi:MAG: hypothetical protein JW750_09470 [Anaerolineaceae bacterium]|nr:hypothetical protein [Anaerolineaceae bacterium]